MNRAIWIRRGAALVVAVCLCLATACVISLVSDLGAVSDAARSEPAKATPSRPAAGVGSAAAMPVLRAGTNAGTALNEYLNGQLGPLGLTITSITPSVVRPLGGGLRLAEVRVEARAEAPGAVAVAQWVAVNREAVRLKSLSMGIGADGDGVATLVLLVVIA